MLKIHWKPAVATLGLAIVAGCTPPPPPPPPPPPRVVKAEPTPYRPVPPAGAAYRMDLPPVTADGTRLSINHGLDEIETIWHFRSGWNVAALNCMNASDAVITTGYGEFLKKFRRELSSANTEMDRRFQQQASERRAAIALREVHSTQVYNYFTLPAVRGDFCNISRLIAQQFMTAPPADLTSFAAVNLQLYENAFANFFNEYERYEQLSADWDRRYGAMYGHSQPGWVAVHGGRSGTSATSSIVGPQTPVVTATVTDPESGEHVPIVPAPEGVVSTPVVQPVPNE